MSPNKSRPLVAKAFMSQLMTDDCLQIYFQPFDKRTALFWDNCRYQMESMQLCPAENAQKIEKLNETEIPIKDLFHCFVYLYRFMGWGDIDEFKDDLTRCV